MKSPISLYQLCTSRVKDIEERAVWQQAQLFEISPVSNWFFEENERGEWDIATDFPMLVPPFQYTWFEHKAPEKILEGPGVVDYKGWVEAIGADIEQFRIGCFCIMEEIKPEHNMPDDLRWSINLGLYASHKKSIFLRGEMTLHLGLDKLGNVAWLKHPTSFSPGKRALWTYNRYDDGAVPVGLFWPFLYSISLLNCKNVTYKTQYHRPQRKVKRSFKGKVPQPKGVTFHTLVVKPMRQAGHGNGSGRSSLRSMHIRRGGFRDYREHGLFGKHKGIYYFGACVVGHMDLGVVEKDYQVRVK